MKCSDMKTEDLAKAYKDALEDNKGQDVTIENLVPRLREVGFTCGGCPGLLKRAKKAFAEAADNNGAQGSEKKPDPSSQSKNVVEIYHPGQEL